MSLSAIFGVEYESIRTAAKFKTINVKLNDLTFPLKVRVPVKREMEAITNAITEPAVEKVEEIYESLAAPLRSALESAEEGFLDALNSGGNKIQLKDKDVLVDGTSVRHIAQMTAIWQAQVEKYFSLLQSATGEPITETYAEIAEEFSEPIIRGIVTQIDEAIRPNFKESKKN
jgi:hypothetical protein